VYTNPKILRAGVKLYHYPRPLYLPNLSAGWSKSFTSRLDSTSYPGRPSRAIANRTLIIPGPASQRADKPHAAVPCRNGTLGFHGSSRCIPIYPWRCRRLGSKISPAGSRSTDWIAEHKLDRGVEKHEPRRVRLAGAANTASLIFFVFP
jgi:hypothetical protein